MPSYFHGWLTFRLILLVHNVLLKIKWDQVWLILKTSACLSQHWFTTLVGLSVVAPIPLPLHLDLISQDHDRLFHLNLSSLHLTAWKLHG